MIAPGSGMIAVAGYVGALAVPLLTLDYFGVPRVALSVACLVAAIAMPVVLARVCRFDALIAEHTSIRS